MHTAKSFAVCPAAMDSQAQVVVRDQERFLFLETPSKKLLLPSSRVKADEDFAAAAQRCITEVCTLVGIHYLVCIAAANKP